MASIYVDPVNNENNVGMGFSRVKEGLQSARKHSSVRKQAFGDLRNLMQSGEYESTPRAVKKEFSKLRKSVSCSDILESSSREEASCAGPESAPEADTTSSAAEQTSPHNIVFTENDFFLYMDPPNPQCMAEFRPRNADIWNEMTYLTLQENLERNLSKIMPDEDEANDYNCFELPVEEPSLPDEDSFLRAICGEKEENDFMMDGYEPEFIDICGNDFF